LFCWNRQRLVPLVAHRPGAWTQERCAEREDVCPLTHTLSIPFERKQTGRQSPAVAADGWEITEFNFVCPAVGMGTCKLGYLSGYLLESSRDFLPRI